MRRLARASARVFFTFNDIEPSVQSWIGHALHADTEGLPARIISATVYRRGTGREAAGVWCAGVHKPFSRSRREGSAE